MRQENPKYFEALEMHPRMLVGRTVPAIGREGEEVLRDSADAKEWQEAVKGLLVQEVRERATRAAEAMSDSLVLAHASIELFQNNPDLIPGTKQFNRALADEFAAFAKPYERRNDAGKLVGYTIPVQPLIDRLRQLQAKAPAPKPTAAPAAKAPPAAPAAPARPKAEPPQAGIPSKSGSGATGEDFSVLFGTLGLPNFRV